MFHFTGTRLRLCAQLTRRPEVRSRLGRTRLIVLQHILSDTAEFLRLLEDAGAEIFAVLAKPYSIDTDVLERVRSRYPVMQHDYPTLEHSGLLETLLHRAGAAS